MSLFFLTYMNSKELYSCELLGKLEDMYIDELSSNPDRERLQSLRDCIDFLKKSHNINDTMRSNYDKYIRLLRAQLIYKDIIDKLSDDKSK